MKHIAVYWTTCQECKGRGKKSRRIRKKVRLSYQRAIDVFEKSNGKGVLPVRPKGHLYTCSICKGSGLISAQSKTVPDSENYPNVAIIGGGIGGMALAVACLHRGIPFTLYERDTSFDARSQGYGLTLQQASKAMEGFGLSSLEKGVVSSRHLVHTPEGKIIGEWGMRKWMKTAAIPSALKRTNIHIARQSLRLALLEQLGEEDTIKWGHQLIDFNEDTAGNVTLKFEVNEKTVYTKADLVVGADGIRSTTRSLLLGVEYLPLQYLDCMVILGICPLTALEGLESSLLDAATVFQTANGHERIYMMPYDAVSVMWQLSFPISEEKAKILSARGAKTLKQEAIKRTPWHEPIPQILKATNEMHISGYPVYDRELLTPEVLATSENITLMGDAAHPMSPFKGQGANQALLDALALARGISFGCRPMSTWREVGIRKSVLNNFEVEMLERSASKVKDSAAAAKLLHSQAVLNEANEPRGRFLKRGEE